jgi:hypothetical protein
MIKIEVTGNSIPEVADKLLAIGSSLLASNLGWSGVKAVPDVVLEVADDGSPLNSAPHPVGNVHVSEDADINPAALTVVEVEVAEAAPVDPTPAPKSAPVATVTESQPTTEEPASTPAPAASAFEPLNFETQVAPVVLLFVQKRSKEETSKILAEFGVERASMLDPALWPELVARLEAEMS